MANFLVSFILNDKQFRNKINRSKAELGKMKSLLKTVGGTSLSGLVGSFAAFGGLVGAGVIALNKLCDVISKAVPVVREFEKKMDSFQSILGISNEEMKYFEVQAARLGGQTTQTASQVADAFRNIGARLPELLKVKEGLVQVTEAAIVLAEASGIDVATSGKALADSINQMGASSAEAAKYVNVLAAGSRNGSADIEYLNQAMEKVGGIASSVGLSFEQVIAIIETIAPKVTEASSAGIQLRQFFLALEKTNDNDLKPSIVGITKALDNLAERNMTISEYAKIFDQRAVLVAKTLVENRDKFNELTQAVTGTNTAFEQANINTDNMIGAMTRLDSAWEDFILNISDPAFQGVVDGFAKVLTNFTDAILKFADAEAYEQRIAARGAAKKTPYIQERMDAMLHNYQYTTNPTTGKNYTKKEAAQYIRQHYKDLMPEYGLDVIDTEEKVMIDNNIISYLDSIINKKNQISDGEKQRIKELKEQEELIKAQSTSEEEYIRLMLDKYKEALKVSQSMTEKIMIETRIDALKAQLKNLQFPKGSLKELSKQISDTKLKLEMAVDDESRKKLYKELKELENKKVLIKMKYVYDSSKDNLNGSGAGSGINIDAIDKQLKEDLPKKLKQISSFDSPLRKRIQEMDDYAESIKIASNALGAFNNMKLTGDEEMDNWFQTSIGQILQTILSLQSLASAKGVTSAMELPFPANIAAALSIVATVAGIFASFPKFANGGIVGGILTTGDRNLARVNSGEMILNMRQQANLFDAISKGEFANKPLSGDVTFRIEGKQLVGVLSNYNNKVSKVL